MTHPTNEELDALVQRLKQLEGRMSFQSQNIAGARTCRLAADAITTLRTQLAEMKVDRDEWFEGWGAMHVAAMREAQRADQNAIRADRAEAALAAQIEADAGIVVSYGEGSSRPVCKRDCNALATAIRNQPHDRTALDRMLAEARAALAALEASHDR